MIFIGSWNFEAMLLNFMIQSIKLIHKINSLLVNQIGYAKVVSNSLLKTKTPVEAQLNNVERCPKFSELDGLCPIELMVISQTIPFMLLFPKQKVFSMHLKVQCVLVPTDLKKIQTILPRTCDDKYLISLALKR